MAELAFQDRLQPALLDRLSDSARTIVVVELRTSRGRLEEPGVTVDAIELAVRPFGLRAWRPDGGIAETEGEDRIVLQFMGPADGGTLNRVRAAPVAGRLEPVPVARVAEVASRAITNRALESASQRVVSMRQLRESVLRDLAWLLSTSSFDSDRSLAAWPEVERSVLNFGLPTVAGRRLSTFDTAAAGARLQKVIETFEPRLTHVRVTPEVDADRMDQRAIVFRVEAELWGQPMPQRLMLRTEIDVDSAHVGISDLESG
jgi:type VI secretion system protein ImpF